MKPLHAAPVLLTAFIAFGAGPAAQPAPVERLTLAVLPCTDIEATFRKFHPLVRHIEGTAGVSLKLVAPASLEELDALLHNGQVDLVLQDPHTWKDVASHLDPGTLLSTLGPDGTREQSGVVVVRRDSGIQRINDLKQRRVVFGPKTSTPKWIAARLLFARAGFDTDRDLAVSHAGCCEDIAFAVVVRSADAGIVCDHFLAMHPDRQRELGIDMAQLRVIARTPPFPNRVMAARRGVAPSTVARVTDALVALSATDARTAPLLAGIEVSAFRRMTGAERIVFERSVTTGLPPQGS